MCVTLKAFFFSHDVYQKSSAVIALISWFFFRCLLNFIFIYETEELAEEEILINLNWKGSIIINRQTRKFALLINIKRNCNNFFHSIYHLSISLSIDCHPRSQSHMDGWMRKSKLHTKNSWICLHTRNNFKYIYVCKEMNILFTSLWASNYDCVHFRESFIMHLLKLSLSF